MGPTPYGGCASEPPLDLIAIDNLPSLLPREASADFSAALLPQLLDFETGGAWGALPGPIPSGERRTGLDRKVVAR